MNGKKAKALRSIAQEMTIGVSAKETRRIYKGLKQSYKNRSPALMARLSEYEK